eukprot:scaffold16863_cov33-Tisochrysis_lutea.AAC.4
MTARKERGRVQHRVLSRALCLCARHIPHTSENSYRVTRPDDSSASADTAHSASERASEWDGGTMDHGASRVTRQSVRSESFATSGPTHVVATTFLPVGIATNGCGGRAVLRQAGNQTATAAIPTSSSDLSRNHENKISREWLASPPHFAPCLF